MRKLIALCCLWAAILTTAQAQIAVNERYLAYVETYAPMAVAEMQAFRIPASITLAQGLLESGGGGSSLARESNNHFGIKCGSSWTGRTHHQEDDDYDGGRLVHSCFRAYPDPAESYRDHSTFLTSSARYAGLFQLDPADYRGWARGLKEAGYATSSTYAPKLIEIIEAYDLARYDQGLVGLPLADRTLTQGAHRRNSGSSSSFGRPTLSGAKLPKKGRGASSSSRNDRVASTSGRATSAADAPRSSTSVQKVNDVEYLQARAGETVNEIAERGQVGARDVIKYNEALSSISESLTEGQRIYLQPKRSNFRGKQKSHRVGASELTQTVADRYGLSTSSLKERNRIAENEEPVRGETLVIRGTRPRKDEPRVMSATARRAEIAKLQTAQNQPKATSTTVVASVEAQPTHETTSRTPQRSTVQSAPRKEVPTVIILPPVSAPVGASASTGSIDQVAVNPSSSRSSTTGRSEMKPQPTPPASEPRFMTVQKGDTLFAISRAAGVPVAEIRALNGLESDAIRVGQRLLVAR